MFGRGTWAILGLVKESLEGFRLTLESPARMAACSQLASGAVARVYGADSLGVNPYSAPRRDEEQSLTAEQQAELARQAIAEQEDGNVPALPDEILNGSGFAHGEAGFQIHPTLPWYGLWAVANEWKKASDLPSIKEQRSYVMLERPYKFLLATDKKTVDEETVKATAIVRTQAPVLLDFNEGRVYIESSNKKLIYATIVRLTQMGAGIIPVGWSYGTANWTEAILNRLHENSQYKDEFAKRAEEAERFKPSEIEKLPDAELESIVAKFFSMTELPNGVWVGLSSPARIRLHAAAPPLGIKAPTSATTLLRMADESAVVTAGVTLQVCETIETRSGAERRVRRDLARMDLNDRINLTEVGAAMLRGFDLTTHRKDVQRQIRQTRQIPSIPQFWGAWLHQLSNAVRTMEDSFRDILEVGGDTQYGIVPMQIAEHATGAAAEND